MKPRYISKQALLQALLASSARISLASERPDIRKPPICRKKTTPNVHRKIERPDIRKGLICRDKRRRNYNDLHLMGQLSNPCPDLQNLLVEGYDSRSCAEHNASYSRASRSSRVSAVGAHLQSE